MKKTLMALAVLSTFAFADKTIGICTHNILNVCMEFTPAMRKQLLNHYGSWANYLKKETKDGSTFTDVKEIGTYYGKCTTEDGTAYYRDDMGTDAAKYICEQTNDGKYYAH